MDSTIRKRDSLAYRFGRLRKTLFASRAILQPALFLSVIALAACDGSSGSGAPSTYTQSQVPGHFVTFSQHCYESGDLPNLLNADADVINTTFQQHGWTLSRYSHDDPSCSNGGYQGFPASQLTDSTTTNADFAWYSGHGVDSGPDFGIIVFWPYSVGTYCNNNPTYCFNRSSTGLPFQGPNIKWFFANVSYGVELPPYDWLSAFSQSGNGLHGFYGFQGEPSDIYGEQLGTEFAAAAIQTSTNPNPVPVRTAWIDAARSNGRADQYGVFELKSANQDQISGNSSNPPYTNSATFSSGNPVVYYDSAGQQSFSPNQTQSLSTQSPGSYQPRSLATEGWSDSYLSSQASANSSGYIETQSTSNVHRFLGTNYTADHYEATSAVIIRTAMSTAAFGDTQANAQQFATSEVAAHGGMPSDAVLARTIVHYSAQTAPTSASPVVIGYDFIWQHSDGTGGGDMIDVGVEIVSRGVVYERLSAGWASQPVTTAESRWV